jgi:hypothetical protein
MIVDDANDRANRGRLERMTEGGDVAGECDAGSPGSDGASPYPELRPYLRRACHEQAPARRMGLLRQPAS